MALEYYVFPDEATANNCIAYINGTPWFPIVGAKKGTPNPDAAKTVRWCDAPREMLSGEWAVPRIPNKRLDFLEVPQADRDAFMAVFGQDIRELEGSDFPVEEEEV